MPQRAPTPAHGTALPQRALTPAQGTALPERTPAPPESARSQPRPYVPTFTPSTISEAASEVIGDATESHKLMGGGRKIWLAAAGAVVVAAGIGVAVTREPSPSGAPLAPAPVAVAPVAKPVEPPPPVTPAANPPPASRLAAPPPAAKVVVRSEPVGATVSIEGRSVGTTPALLTLSLPQEIVVSHKGYRSAREVLSNPGETIVRLQPEPRAKAPAARPKKGPVEKPAAAPPPPPPARSFREGLD
jgi:hypothetical protein